MNEWNVTKMSKRARKSWIDNAIIYSETGNPGSCPICGSTNINAFILEIGRRSINFKCNSCGNLAHFDGPEISKEK